MNSINKLTLSLGSALVLSALAGIAADKKPAKPDLSKLPPAATKTVDFDKDLKPLIEASCLKCHSGEKPKSKYVMDTKENIIKGGKEGVAVVPGKSAESPIVHYVADAVEDMEMPPTDKREKYPALTKPQIGLLRAWIDQGAK